MILEQEDFFRIYKPFKNHFYDNAEYNGCLFTTSEFSYIEQIPNKHVWTLVSGDNSSEYYIIPGVHLINREGYFYTEEPWESEDIEINLNDLISVERAIDLTIEFLESKGFYNKSESVINFFRENT